MAEDQGTEGIRLSFERISRWMSSHGAPLLVENLADGATPERLANAEAELGWALPSDLRGLWSLHDGQREEGNGFIEAYNLLSVKRAIAEQETVLIGIEYAREEPAWWKDSGGTTEELDSNHWLPFAAQDSDALVVHGVTGRVFRCDHDDSPKLLAPSLGEWLEQYAERVETDDYAVEEGFGDYFLSLRDREAERREQERAQREREHERMRRETPLLDQFRAAIAQKDEDRCIEVLKDALERDDKDAFSAAVRLLFAGDLETKFVAAALRPVLKAVTLEPDQWVDVVVGGALLGNNAVRDIGLSHAAGFSQTRLKRLAKAAAAASPGERAALNNVLQKLWAMKQSDAPPPPDGHTGNWFSRFFKKPPPKA
jgi:cell wall assembly regulator SMI1